MNNKQNIYLEGIRKLKEKQCDIYIIDFPYHESLQQVENKSMIKSKINGFLEKSRDEAGCNRLYTLCLDNDKQVMHDLTHLNCNGAEQVSVFIANKIMESDSYSFSIKNKKKISHL